MPGVSIEFAERTRRALRYYSDPWVAMLTNVVERFLRRIAYRFLMLSGGALHVYTAVTAFDLVNSWYLASLAAVGAWVTPGLAQMVVTYYAWSATGSRVNYYSIWLLAWLVLLLVVMLMTDFVKRLGRIDR